MKKLSANENNRRVISSVFSLPSLGKAGPVPTCNSVVMDTFPKKLAPDTHNQNAELTWGNSYYLNSYLGYIKRAKETNWNDYLDYSRELAQAILWTLNSLDKNRGYARQQSTWSIEKYTPRQPYATLGSDAIIARNIADFALIIRNDPSLAHQEFCDGVTFRELATYWTYELLEIEKAHRHEWNPEMGSHLVNSDVKWPVTLLNTLRGAYETVNISDVGGISGNHTLPWNLITPSAHFLVDLYLLTDPAFELPEHITKDRQLYRLMAHTMCLQFRQYLESNINSSFLNTYVNGSHIWGYWAAGPYLRDRNYDDYSHAALTSSGLLACYENGIGNITPGLMFYIAKGIRYEMYSADGRYRKAFRSSNTIGDTDKTNLWYLYYTRFDDQEEISRQVQNNVISYPAQKDTRAFYFTQGMLAGYGGKNNVKTTCTVDTDCRTNLCITKPPIGSATRTLPSSLSGICSYPIRDGGVCSRNKECRSYYCNSLKNICEPQSQFSFNEALGLPNGASLTPDGGTVTKDIECKGHAALNTPAGGLVCSSKTISGRVFPNRRIVGDYCTDNTDCELGNCNKDKRKCEKRF